MNYPGGIKHKVKNDKSTKINTNYGNRGMTLENELNSSNDYYRLIDKAIIYKKPTPIKITNVDYPSRDKAVIKEAYFTVPSTTDYNGIYKGKYIDFNNNRKSIPIDYFRENCYLIKDNLKPTVDYLKIIDILMEEKNG